MLFQVVAPEVIFMNPEVEQIDDTQAFVPPEVDTVPVDMNGEEPVTLTPYSEASKSNEQWQQVGERISSFLSDLPDYLTEFFSEYKRSLITIGLVLGAFVSVKLMLAILDSVNDIPLLAPTFEIIGIGYSAWFVYRYLLQDSNRKELGDSFNTLRKKVLGGTTNV
jgi:hypothetical protein